MDGTPTLAADRYIPGFGSHVSTEAVAGALPIGRNAPQRAPLGLYAEQLSGTAFTAPRAENRRSWLYRMRPAAAHGPFAPAAFPAWRTAPFALAASPNRLRWDPLAMPEAPTDFVDGMVTLAGNGEAGGRIGVGIHAYLANRSMDGRYFYNADGELLIVPQQGALEIATELGVLDVRPGEIGLVPRGVRFAVRLPDRSARGWVCENYG